MKASTLVVCATSDTTVKARRTSQRRDLPSAVLHVFSADPIDLVAALLPLAISLTFVRRGVPDAAPAVVAERSRAFEAAIGRVVSFLPFVAWRGLAAVAPCLRTWLGRE